jgi:hypothetical protein
MTQPDATCQIQPNVPLMRKILEQIEVDPSSLLMGEWAVNLNIRGYRTEDAEGTLEDRGLVNTCGTTRCIAGWAAEFTGWEPSFESSGAANYARRDNMVGEIADIGQTELGLTNDQAASLFYLDDDRDQIRATMEEIAGERL